MIFARELLTLARNAYIPVTRFDKCENTKPSPAHCCVPRALQRRMCGLLHTHAMNSQAEPESLTLSSPEYKLSYKQIQTTLENRGESKVMRGKLRDDRLLEGEARWLRIHMLSS